MALRFVIHKVNQVIEKNCLVFSVMKIVQQFIKELTSLVPEECKTVLVPKGSSFLFAWRFFVLTLSLFYFGLFLKQKRKLSNLWHVPLNFLSVIPEDKVN